MKLINKVSIGLILILGLIVNGQKINGNYSTVIEKVEPPNWWVGFKNEKLQLLVYGKNIGNYKPSIDYPGVSIIGINKAQSPNYLFVDFEITDKASPGTIQIVFNKEGGRKPLVYPYVLRGRKKKSIEYKGFDNSDAIYLITPDRFANGEISNDVIENMNETSVDRSEDYSRHGGDIAGIINGLDYISDMGFTSLWITPLLTNDMSQSSYHGYAITDFYQVDPRFGTLEEYIRLSEVARQKGLDLIMDQVANHCGVQHWWAKDLPFDDWFNFQDLFEGGQELIMSNHRRTTNQDPYASSHDKIFFNDGWFVPIMPDLNQKNPFMAKYLIQNSIWWIEILGLHGIRQDTYPYPDKDFMSEWAGSIMNEYPNFSIVGEEWSNNPLLVAYWQDGNNNLDGYKSNLGSTMDFPMQKAIVEGINEEESWDKGLIKLYEGLANDFGYPSPNRIMGFLDNHDMDRVFTQLNEDLVSTKMALSYLLVIPRIPQIYYGTETLISNIDNLGDHGSIRTDFPGGWATDSVNAFTGKNLSDDQMEIQGYLKTLLNYRKESNAIISGKTVHFVPFNGVYVLFRILGDDIVMHVMNKNNTSTDIDLKRFEELELGGKVFTNIETGESFTWEDNLSLPKRGSYLFTTIK
ncbi:glycoside hydrolase family 13 protein [Muricauda sp. ANG21]|uniref:glycoside hydrolase family 13 protein n=1 Tax=Allomuricauda sp. ANG21 TaxID=3042468 RepID=UPI0034566804